MAAARREHARHWRYEELPGVDLLRARYVRKEFTRHTHEHFVIAAIAEGVEVYTHVREVQKNELFVRLYLESLEQQIGATVALRTRFFSEGELVPHLCPRGYISESF